jgi:hypothetical protein
MLNQTEDRIRATGRARAAACAVCLLIWAAGAATPTSTAPSSPEETYRWTGELVALDEGTGTLTVKARVLSPAVLAESDGLRAGDSIVLTWTGFGDRASGVWSVARANDAADASIDGSESEGTDQVANETRFPLQAAFEAIDADSRYLTFRIPLPAGSRSAVRSLTRGTWVRMTSPRDPADAQAALLAVNAYAPAPETPPVAAGGGEKTFVWPGKLISIHAEEGAVTVSAPAEQHVFRYVERFSKGDGVVLLWAPGDGYAVTAIRYLEHRGPEDNGRLGLDHGYVLPAEFVSGDEDSRRITFKTKVPATSFDALARIQSGQWVKVTSPFDQRSHEGAAILAVEHDAERDTQAQE